MTDDHRVAIVWAEASWGQAVQEVQTLTGGWTSTILRLTAVNGDRAVLRLMTKEPWRTYAGAMLRREAEVQRQLSRSAIPVPTSLALDPDGAVTGSPAHLMTWLPGSLELSRSDDEILTRLAGLLRRIHRHDPGDRRPREYQSWAHPAKRVVPEWSEHPALWRRAFQELERTPPPYGGTFLHRDFHLGNVLWQDGEVSGVVDWVETSWGPAGLDVAHATTYLAMLHGTGVADRFVAAYRESGPGPEGQAQRYWQLMDIVGYLPDPAKVVQPWRDRGQNITDRVARSRLEELLDSVL